MGTQTMSAGTVPTGTYVRASWHDRHGIERSRQGRVGMASGQGVALLATNGQHVATVPTWARAVRR